MEMEPSYGKDREYMEYLYTLKEKEFDPAIFRDRNMTTKAIEMNLLESAKMLLLEMGILEKNRSKEETLKRIVILRAWNLTMDCDCAASARRSLTMLATSYKGFIPGLNHFRDMEGDRLAIYSEFKACVDSSKVSL